MKFLAQKRYFFAPALNGNETLEEDEQLQVEVIRATAENHGKLRNIRAWRNSQGETVMETVFDTKEILRSCVGEIRNLEVEVEDADGKVAVKKITSGKELAEATFYGCGALVSLICAEVASDIITPTEKKICE